MQPKQAFRAYLKGVRRLRSTALVVSADVPSAQHNEPVMFYSTALTMYSAHSLLGWCLWFSI